MKPAGICMKFVAALFLLIQLLERIDYYYAAIRYDCNQLSFLNSEISCNMIVTQSHYSKTRILTFEFGNELR